MRRIKLNPNSSPNPTSRGKRVCLSSSTEFSLTEMRERGSLYDENTFYRPSTVDSFPKTSLCAESRWPHGFSPTLRPPAPPSSNSNWACLHSEFAIGQQCVTIGPSAVLTKRCHVNTALQVRLWIYARYPTRTVGCCVIPLGEVWVWVMRIFFAVWKYGYFA